ncbi:GNAT family N-acetyltransferase [Thalassotalea aquiviva]|uniref:GNAT family N-acetyltransferase n=1 Tax=Thalassotalea aquiviva TaxID=3242415 RepID=UPI00352B73B5
MQILEADKNVRKNIKRFYKQQHYSASFMGYDRCFYIAKPNQDIIASVILSEIEHVNFLHALVVDKAYQKQGFASQLIDQCANIGTPIFCFADNKLDRLYQSKGFHLGQESQLPDALAKRWHSYVKKSPNLLIYQYD